MKTSITTATTRLSKMMPINQVILLSFGSVALILLDNLEYDKL